MEQVKRISALILAIFLAVSPTMAFCDFSYSEDGDDITWNPCASEEEVTAAWKAYLASRNISYNGNPVNALVSWSYDDINSKLQELGTDMDTLQSGLWYTYSRYSSGGVVNPLRFMYNASAISILNSLFAKYATQNGFSDIDGSSFTNTLKNGEVFSDKDGYSCFVFNVNQRTGSRVDEDVINTKILTYGSPYRFTGNYLFSHLLNGNNNYVIRVNDQSSISYFLNKTVYNNNDAVFLLKYETDSPSLTNAVYLYKTEQASGSMQFEYLNGYLSVFKYGNNYYLGNYVRANNGSNGIEYCWNANISLNNSTITNAAIQIASEGLKAGVKEMAKGAVIDVAKKGLNEGYETIKKFLEDDDISDTNEQPTDENGDIINNNNIFIGGILNADGSINFQMPDTSSFAPHGFSIQGLLQKFPFCIPLDIYAVIDLLDAEPVTPRIQQTVDFGSFNYDIDINLAQFDPVMVFWRKAMLILYIFGIIFITPYIVK